MSIRKMAGLFLIVIGLAQYIYLLTNYAPPGRAILPLYFIAVLLFTVGSVLFRWKGKWGNNSKAHG